MGMTQKKLDYFYSPYNQDVECVKGMTIIDDESEMD